jgi:hypothetical protein
MKIKTQWDFISHPLKCLLWKREKITSVSEYVEKREAFHTVSALHSTVALQNSTELSQKIKNTITM